MIAAVLAGLATLLVISTLRGGPAPSANAPLPDPGSARAGESSVPVTLASAGLAAVLQVGDVVDLVSVAAPENPRVVATAARILQVPSGGGVLSSTSTIVMVAVPASQALAVTAAASQEALTFVIPGTPSKR